MDSKILKPPYLLENIFETLEKNYHLKIFSYHFDIKYIEKINASSIFHFPLIKVALPNASAHFDTPNVVYILIKP